jgi:PAS domain S-box-containing protein
MLWVRSDLRTKLARSPVLVGLALAAAYVVAGRLGLLLAVPPGYATAIFPSAGVAVAAMLIAGRVTLPWTFLGSFVLNLWAGYDANHRLDALVAAVALVIASASTLQASIGGTALRRLISYPASLDNGRDLARFFLSSPVLCLTSATLSLSAMAALGAIGTADLPTSWLTWWIGDTLGVLLVLPLIMIAVGEPRALWRSRALPVAVPLLLFFALFVAIFIRVSAWENEQSLLEFRILRREVLDGLQARLAAQQVFLEQLNRSFAGPARLSRNDFRDLAQGLLLRFPFIRAVEWAPKVENASRAEFEAAQRQDLSGFEIRERDEQRQLRRAGERPEFYPVTYLEPLHGNEPALGFDLASEPKRRSAVEAAIEGKHVTASAPIRLVQETGEQSGVLLTSAVPGGPNGAGVVLIVLRMGTFMEALLESANPSIAVQLVDLDDDRPLFDTLSGSGRDTLYEQTFDLAARRYAVRTAPSSVYLAQHRSWQSLAVLMAGVFGTSLLGALLMLGTGERHRFARLLTERTRERDRIWRVSEDLLGVGNFDGYFVSINPAWTRTLGWSEDEIKSMHVSELRHPDDAAIGAEGRRRLAAGIGTVRMENRFRRKDGSHRWIYWTMTTEKGLIYVIGRDVTADKEAAQSLRQAEEQLRQSQKMESVGHLTGGIAHDFNNLLTIIVGNLEIVERALGASASKVRDAIAMAMGGAMRAVTLTQRLLAYAQKQPLRPSAVDLNKLVTGMSDLIRRTQGETISYEFSLRAELSLCLCDANQLETALLNLVINACDAMPHGGRLEVETADVALEGSAAGARRLAAGSYVTLAVSDTGIGMSPETAAHAFEPFFTTKSAGRGTGLGLSMVYGFVNQSKGYVEIDTVLGRGTTVRIFLPQLPAAAAPEAPSEALFATVVRHATGETILVTEDDASVRGYVVETLREMNYHVLEAPNGAEALAIITQEDLRIDLLLTDVVMPGINGRELADQAKAIQPNIKVLFMTGYSQDAIVHQGRLDPGIELIEKPFRRDALVVRVRAVLDSGLSGNIVRLAGA